MKKTRVTIEEWTADTRAEGGGDWEVDSQFVCTKEKVLAAMLRAKADELDPQDKELTPQEMEIAKNVFGVDLSAFMGKGQG